MFPPGGGNIASSPNLQCSYIPLKTFQTGNIQISAPGYKPNFEISLTQSKDYFGSNLPLRSLDDTVHIILVVPICILYRISRL